MALDQLNGMDPNGYYGPGSDFFSNGPMSFISGGALPLKMAQQWGWSQDDALKQIPGGKIIDDPTWGPTVVGGNYTPTDLGRGGSNTPLEGFGDLLKYGGLAAGAAGLAFGGLGAAAGGVNAGGLDGALGDAGAGSMTSQMDAVAAGSGGGASALTPAQQSIQSIFGPQTPASTAGNVASSAIQAGTSGAGGAPTGTGMGTTLGNLFSGNASLGDVASGLTLGQALQSGTVLAGGLLQGNGQANAGTAGAQAANPLTQTGRDPYYQNALLDLYKNPQSFFSTNPEVQATKGAVGDWAQANFAKSGNLPLSAVTGSNTLAQTMGQQYNDQVSSLITASGLNQTPGYAGPLLTQGLNNQAVSNNNGIQGLGNLFGGANSSNSAQIMPSNNNPFQQTNTISGASNQIQV